MIRFFWLSLKLPEKKLTRTLFHVSFPFLFACSICIFSSFILFKTINLALVGTSGIQSGFFNLLVQQTREHLIFSSTHKTTYFISWHRTISPGVINQVIWDETTKHRHRLRISLSQNIFLAYPIWALMSTPISSKHSIYPL